MTVEMGGAAFGWPGGQLVRRVDAWLLKPAPPERLAVFRILVGSYATIAMIVSVGEFARLAGRPALQFEPVGLAGLLEQPLPSNLLWGLFGLSVLSGLAFTVGAAFRYTGWVFAVCQLVWATYHASWGQMLHFEHLVTLHVLVLGFAPAAHAYSVDAYRAERSIIPDTRYGWPLRLAAIITVVTYVLSGVAKLRIGGLAWLNSETLTNHIAYSATRMDLLGEPRPPLASLAIANDWVLQPMAVASVAVELFAPLALLGGWFRRVWVPAAILLHLGTLTLMFVFFSYNGLGFALLPLYRLERLVPKRVHARLDPPKRAEDVG